MQKERSVPSYAWPPFSVEGSCGVRLIFPIGFGGVASFCKMFVVTNGSWMCHAFVFPLIIQQVTNSSKLEKSVIVAHTKNVIIKLDPIKCQEIWPIKIRFL